MYVDITKSYPRTAPAAWGQWPAEPERFADAARRSLITVARIAEQRRYPPDAIVEAWLHDPGEFAVSWFPAECTGVVIGCVLIRAAGRAWRIDWNPETGAGVVSEFRALLPHEIARATKSMTRLLEAD